MKQIEADLIEATKALTLLFQIERAAFTRVITIRSKVADAQMAYDVAKANRELSQKTVNDLNRAIAQNIADGVDEPELVVEPIGVEPVVVEPSTK